MLRDQRTHFFKSLKVLTLLTFLWSSILPVMPAYAGPEGGVVSAGTATITSFGTKTDVHQTTKKAVIDWRSFDVGINEHTQFHQPGKSSVTLNRINDVKASSIDGKITANGNIILVNPNGMVFGSGAQVNVNSLVATTANTTNADFMSSGKTSFGIAGNSTGKIVNNGTITAGKAGLVGLVAPQVENSGVIAAQLGEVNMASGDTFTLDMTGDGKISVAASAALQDQLVKNSGTIQADGGRIFMTAAAAREQVDSLIDNNGVLQARSIGKKDGKIVLFAEGSNAVTNNSAADKGVKAGVSTVLNKGTIDVSAATDKTKGGYVAILGDHIGLMDGSKITANGKSAAGGEVRVGGDYQGKGVTPAAKSTYVAPTAKIEAKAETKGNGGKVIVWADDTTRFNGSIDVRGGETSGKGGFVEVSGKQHLDFKPADMQLGGGDLLLDPGDIVICQFGASSDAACNPAGAPALVAGGGIFDSAANALSYVDIGSAGTGGSLLNILQSGSVKIQTNAGGGGNGDISLVDALTWGTGNGLTLTAHRDININAAITGGGDIFFNAGRSISVNSAIDMQAHNLILSAADDITLGAALAGSGVLTFRTASAASNIYIGGSGGAGHINLSTAELDRISNGWDEIVFGDAALANTIYFSGNYNAWKDPVRAAVDSNSGQIDLSSSQSGQVGSNASFTFSGPTHASGGYSARYLDFVMFENDITIADGASVWFRDVDDVTLQNVTMGNGSYLTTSWDVYNLNILGGITAGDNATIGFGAGDLAFGGANITVGGDILLGNQGSLQMSGANHASLNNVKAGTSSYLYLYAATEHNMMGLGEIDIREVDFGAGSGVNIGASGVVRLYDDVMVDGGEVGLSNASLMNDLTIGSGAAGSIYIDGLLDTGANQLTFSGDGSLILGGVPNFFSYNVGNTQILSTDTDIEFIHDVYYQTGSSLIDTGAGDIIFSADLVLEGSLMNGRTLTIGNGGNLYLGGDIVAGQQAVNFIVERDMILTANTSFTIYNGGLTFQGITANGYNLTLDGNIVETHFQGDIDMSTGLLTLTGIDMNTFIGGNITTANAQVDLHSNQTGWMSLEGDVIIDTGTADIHLGTIGAGDYNFTLVTGGGDAYIYGPIISNTGTLDMRRRLILQANSPISSASGDLHLGEIVGNSMGVSILGGGNNYLYGNIIASFSAIDLQGGGSFTLMDDVTIDVGNSGGFEYISVLGDVIAGAHDLTISGLMLIMAGSITSNDAKVDLSGAGNTYLYDDFVINTGMGDLSLGTTSIDGPYLGATASLTLLGGGETYLHGDITSYDYVLDLRRNITLENSVTLNAGTADIMLGNVTAAAGAHDLSLAGTGSALLYGDIALDTGHATFNRDITLMADAGISSNSGNIFITAGLDGAFDLRMGTTGDIILSTAAGSGTALDNVTVTNSGDFTASAGFRSASFTQQSGTGMTSFGGGGLFTTGDIDITTSGISGIYSGLAGNLVSGAGETHATVTFQTLNVGGTLAHLTAGNIGATAGPATQAMANLITVNGMLMPSPLPEFTYDIYLIGYAPPSGSGVPPTAEPPEEEPDEPNGGGDGGSSAALDEGCDVGTAFSRKSAGMKGEINNSGASIKAQNKKGGDDFLECLNNSRQDKKNKGTVRAKSASIAR